MKFADYKKADIQDKLKFWRDLPDGTPLTPPGWPDDGGWSRHIRDLVIEALLEIEFLRKLTGPVSKGSEEFDIGALKKLRKPGLY